MKLKTRVKAEDLEESLQVVLHEALLVAQEFSQKAKKFNIHKPGTSTDDGRYGELAALAFLLKLKAEALQEMLEHIIEEEADDD
jgi:hypothetical protein